MCLQEHEVTVKIFKAFTVHCSVMSLRRRLSTRSQANHLPKPQAHLFSHSIHSFLSLSLSPGPHPQIFSFQPSTLHFLSPMPPFLQPWAWRKNEWVSEPGCVKQQLARSQSAAWTAPDDCQYSCTRHNHTLVIQQRAILMDSDTDPQHTAILGWKKSVQWRHGPPSSSQQLPHSSQALVYPVYRYCCLLD